MKKLFGLFFITLLAVAPASAGAPTWLEGATSGQFEVKGYVEARCTVQVRDHDRILDLTKGERNKKVATIKETCNAGAGYTVSFDFEGNGDLQHETYNDTVDFTFNYDGFSSNDLADGVELTRDGGKRVRVNDVRVDVKGNPNRLAGSYTNSVLVSIAAN